MGTTVWLARHGEVHNPKQVFYGRLPRMGLSPAGRRQAEALADLRGLPLELVHVRAQGPNPSIYLPTASVARVHFAPDGTLRDLALLVPPYDQPHLL